MENAWESEKINFHFKLIISTTMACIHGLDQNVCTLGTNFCSGVDQPRGHFWQKKNITKIIKKKGEEEQNIAPHFERGGITRDLNPKYWAYKAKLPGRCDQFWRNDEKTKKKTKKKRKKATLLFLHESNINTIRQCVFNRITFAPIWTSHQCWICTPRCQPKQQTNFNSKYN